MNCICLAKEIPAERLVKLLKKYFRLGDVKIACFHSVDEFNDRGTSGGANIIFTPLTGDFKLWVDLYGFPETTDDELAQFIAKLTGAAVLITDDSINPYQWILVSPSGKRLVHVNPAALDDQDSFVIEDIVGTTE